MAQPQMMQIKLSRFDAQPWGFRLQGGTDFAQPLLVQKVNGGSLAEKAGLMPGDAVIKINDVDVFNLRHKDAQDIVVRSGNNFVMTVQRGGSTWRPHVQLTGNVPHPNAGNLHTVTKTSLAHKQQEVQHIGSGYNNSARPFGGSAVDGNVKSIVNKQYNTPVGIYSDESIAETLSAQAEVLAGGVLGVNFKKNEKEYQADKSEVLKFLREEESGTSTPEPPSATSYYATKSHAIGGNELRSPQTEERITAKFQKPTTTQAPPPSAPAPSKVEIPVPTEPEQPDPRLIVMPVCPALQTPEYKEEMEKAAAAAADGDQPKPYTASGHPACSMCGVGIVGVFVRIKDKNLHVECFKCATCGTNLKNQGYYNFNNKLYCDIHAKLAALQNPPPGTEGYVPVPIKPNTKLSASTISSALNTHGYNNGVSNGSSTPTPAPAADMNLNDLPLPPPPSPTQLQQYEQDQGNVTNISNIPPPPPHTRTLSSLSSMSSGSNTTHSSTHSLSPTPYQYQHQGQGPCNNVIMQTHNITMDPYASTSPMHSRQTSSSSSSLNYASDNNYMTSPPPPPPPPLPLPSMLPPAAEDNRNGDLYIDTMKQQQNAIGSNNSSKLLTNRNNENDKNSYNKSGNGNGIGVGNGTTFQPNTHKVAPTAVTGPTSTITTTKSPSSSNIPIVDKSLINSNNTYNPESNTTTTTTTFNTGTNDMSSTMASSGPSVQPTSETSSNGVGGDKPFEYVTLTGNVIRSVVPPGKGTNVNYKVNNQGYARPYGAPPAAAPKSPVTFPPQTQQWNAPPPTQPKPSAPAGNPYATLPRSNVGQGQGSASNASNFAANSQPPRQQQQQQSQATAPATKAPAASSASAPTTMSNQNNNGGSAGSTGSAGGMAPKGGSYGATSAPKRGRGVMNKPAGPGVRIPLCNSCGTQVRGPFITALGKIWCPEHFHCTNGNCRRPLQDIGFVEEKGDLYCEYCFEKYLAPGCSKCGGKIKGDCLNAIGKHFHPECFSCGHCGKLFGNTPFFLEDGMPYCEADWNELFTTKCFACGFPVEAGDRWVEALNHNYHSQCFNCTYCKQNLEGQSFYNKGGRPFCKNHAR
ncbi:Z band alternatively spliced PDZ-motif protein 52 isoform X16 [Haematobia irritans]|uniref:Z band alternatively spliced PDZ-motif protein 52 isoform X16 n=1 Tax=Haematobia irritans TaxID=7368 RepID=UPI003F4FFBB0